MTSAAHVLVHAYDPQFVVGNAPLAVTELTEVEEGAPARQALREQVLKTDAQYEAMGDPDRPEVRLAIVARTPSGYRLVEPDYDNGWWDRRLLDPPPDLQRTLPPPSRNGTNV